jgi:predicted nucleic acid-binding protein
MMLVDTSGLLAALSPDQRSHEACAEVLTKTKGPLFLSPFVLAEMDYLVSKVAGIPKELTLLREVEGGAYDLPSFELADIKRAREIIEQYSDLGIGLADASIVVLSEKHNALDLLTLDERHFRTLRGARGRPFRILPADA